MNEDPRQTPLPLEPLAPAPDIREATFRFDKAMWNRWCATLLRQRTAGILLTAEPGQCVTASDGTLYGVALDGSFHVARDSEGRKLRPPRRPKGPAPTPGALEPNLPRQGDTQVAAPPPIGLPGATSR